MTADIVEHELETHPGAVVTDVASIKLAPLRELRVRGVDLRRYIGSHPMAGRERSGAIAARADLFVGRPWVVCRDAETSAADLALVEGSRARSRGATLVEMTPEEHDCVRRARFARAAARRESPRGSVRGRASGVAASGRPGDRDTTRIAASARSCGCRSSARTRSPSWASSTPSRRSFLPSPTHCGQRMPPARAVPWPTRSGAATTAVERLPGKHGQNSRYESFVVMVEDRAVSSGVSSASSASSGSTSKTCGWNIHRCPVRPCRDQRRARDRACRGRGARGARLADREHRK